MAMKSMSLVAERMNNAAEAVFSRTLDQASKKIRKIVKSDLAGTIRKLKGKAGPDLIIFGSGTAAAELAQKELIGEYQIAQIPLVLGSGRTMFDGMKQQQNLKLTKSRTFTNGNIFYVTSRSREADHLILFSPLDVSA